MSTLPTIDEARAHVQSDGDAQINSSRRAPSASPPSAAASASPSAASTGSSPAPAQQQRRSDDKRKRHAYESDSDSDDDNASSASGALPQRNVHARTSPSPSRGSAAGASARAQAATGASPAAPAAAHDPSLFGCRGVSAYKRLNTIDEGSYGVVHRAEDRVSGVQVALKKIKLDSAQTACGFPITSLREINILLSLRHRNIVELREIVTAPAGKGKQHAIYMVMEYAEHDLKALMLRMGAGQDDRDVNAAAASATLSGAAVVPPSFKPFRVPEVKNLLRQLLEGLAYTHRHWVLHRDLKTSNLLYTNGGVLKICDFGLARRYGDPLGDYTPLVVTLWYRAPELLWGTKNYSAAVDMWSVGCIFAELLLNRPLLTGQSEMEQISKMLKLLGTPNVDEWPEFLQLEHAQNYSFAKTLPSRLRELFPTHSYAGSTNVLSDAGFNLLSQLLEYNPARRISAADALNHPYFAEAPLPQSQALMPTFPASNERMHDDEARGPNSGDLRRKREQESMGFFLAQ